LSTPEIVSRPVGEVVVTMGRGLRGAGKRRGRLGDEPMLAWTRGDLNSRLEGVETSFVGGSKGAGWLEGWSDVNVPSQNGAAPPNELGAEPVRPTDGMRDTGVLSVERMLAMLWG
jgi:hypothetical protein